MKKLSLVITLALFSLAFSSSAAKKLSDHQVLVDCNKSASALVEFYEKEVKLKESRRLDLIEIISGACQYGYQSAQDGMQYKDIERGIIADARKEAPDYEDQDPAVLERRVGLILASIQAGFYIFNNGGLSK
ncbi:hypothetical protein [Serratia fonticola]|uniref:DUF3718 domain-containing protein n=1 Tax=Serratia fonticola TaxID=47917 RepID=A0AAE7EHE4_SERFO|nr:hypothetical protein [Serratia fonticola]QKJ58800.1 hypothetical protein G9399_11030 [Serratia fonticola]